MISFIPFARVCVFTAPGSIANTKAGKRRSAAASLMGVKVPPIQTCPGGTGKRSASRIRRFGDAPDKMLVKRDERYRHIPVSIRYRRYVHRGAFAAGDRFLGQATERAIRYP